MSLFVATLLTGLVLLGTGIALFRQLPALRRGLETLPRSPLATVVLFGTATVWVLWNVTQLGAADFGNHKELIFVAFLALAIASFFAVPDFLAVRGLAVLGLLVAAKLLAAAYFQEPTQRLFLVSFVYVMILACIVIGAAPYHFQRFFRYLFARPSRFRAAGAVSALYGLLLVLVAFTY